MKLTNKLNLPGPLYKAICNDSYNPGDSDYTATGLIEPARIGALKIAYASELTEDASDRIYSLQGQSIHTILERAAENLKAEGYIPEERFYGSFGNKKVGAQIDVFHPSTGLLQDYKLTSVYKVKDGITEEYAQQLNIQAELLRRNGHVVKKMEIVAILRDWSKSKYQKELQKFGARTNYPANQVVILDVPIIESSEVVAFINERIRAHDEARSGVLPECTAAERWASEQVYAVMKKGIQTARRLFYSREQAEEFLGSEKNLYIEDRPVENRRCENYCPVSKFCSQYQKLKGDK